MVSGVPAALVSSSKSFFPVKASVLDPGFSGVFSGVSGVSQGFLRGVSGVFQE